PFGPTIRATSKRVPGPYTPPASAALNSTLRHSGEVSSTDPNGSSWAAATPGTSARAAPSTAPAIATFFTIKSNQRYGERRLVRTGVGTALAATGPQGPRGADRRPFLGGPP